MGGGTAAEGLVPDLEAASGEGGGELRGRRESLGRSKAACFGSAARSTKIGRAHV